MTMPEADDVRLCAGCGRRKVDCPCWAAGAGDEARHLRNGFDKDQLALMDYIRAVLEYGKHPIPTLLAALQVEFAAENTPFFSRVRAAWSVLRG